MLAESLNDNIIPYSVFITSDKSFLKNIKTEIFNLVQESYRDEGGFKGASDARNLIRDTDLAKLVFDENDNIVALALYRDDLDGHKRFCSATNKLNPRYKEAHQEIIKSDIEPYSNWYWTTASGKNEYYFKKHKGNPIPNYIAVELLGLSANPTLNIEPDGLHFSYMSKGDDPTLLRKMMFGFNNQTIYDRVMRDVENYDQYKLSVDNLESFLTESSAGLNKHIRAMCLFISKLFDMHNQDEVNEVPVHMYTDLTKSIDELEDFLQTNSNDASVNRIKAVLRRAYICRDEIEPMILHKIDINDFKVI